MATDVLLPDVKTALRVTHTALDSEINDLILAARKDLFYSGVGQAVSEATDSIDPLIKRAIVVYCKANFLDNVADTERFQLSYDLLKTHLALSGDYQDPDTTTTGTTTP
ncbi:head-tail connector protein [Sporolactobacillus sp. CQH2019]|uniref:head-tail connector protein n=1 Tax=Sporolactobacillus sp. CQH2019 TaxID=3023512 RepID=UPI00236815AC|nr:head-tail connector protein [Sporolactobacillus sp. CQH2019]MDD9148155.1 head-tail connector protein [Sporolactobacillus sp. CQH2019]